MKDDEKEGFGTALFGLAMVPVIMLADAYVMRALWTWFVVPLGVPAIGMAHAYGINVLVSILTPKSYRKRDDRPDNSVWYLIGVGFATPAFAYAIGYVAHMLQ